MAKKAMKGYTTCYVKLKWRNHLKILYLLRQEQVESEKENNGNLHVFKLTHFFLEFIEIVIYVTFRGLYFKLLRCGCGSVDYHYHTSYYDVK